MEVINETHLNHWEAPTVSPDPLAPIDVRFGKIDTMPELIAAMDAFPKDASLTYQLSIRLIKEKKYAMAEHVLRALLKRENCFEVLEKLAVCLYHLNQWSECAHIARQALMLGEGFRDQRFELLKFLGNCLIQIKDFDGAQEAYEKAFALFPGSGILQVNFGTLWIQRSDWNRATECFRYALFLEPENDRGWVGLALCHHVRGDFDLARANLERALDANPLNETAITLLIDWGHSRREFLAAAEHFMYFVDRGGFSEGLSSVFVKRAEEFGETALANWEKFHLHVRGEDSHV